MAESVNLKFNKGYPLYLASAEMLPVIVLLSLTMNPAMTRLPIIPNPIEFIFPMVLTGSCTALR